MNDLAEGIILIDSWILHLFSKGTPSENVINLQTIESKGGGGPIHSRNEWSREHVGARLQ